MVQNLLRRLTYEHANLSAYSVMRVNLAAQALSSTVAKVLRSFGPPEVAGTTKLWKWLMDFWTA